MARSHISIVTSSKKRVTEIAVLLSGMPPRQTPLLSLDFVLEKLVNYLVS